MNASRTEVMRYLATRVQDAIPTFLKTEDTYWQPADFLPDLAQEDGLDRVRALQEGARGLSDELLVTLVGNMVTEEALPTYSAWIHQMEGVDRAGEPRNAWGDWARAWTAEENRHGEVLNRYLYLCGRVNMREIEVTVHNLIIDGGDIGAGADPYKMFTYTSFQETATNYSHRNVAAIARAAGDETLARLCGFVAGDETRHARAYKRFFSLCLEVDPSNALIAFRDMMKSKITMPAMYMRERGLRMGETFKKFADIAERIEVYTPRHYAEILEKLIRHWRIDALTGLTPEARAAQDYLCGLPTRYYGALERIRRRLPKAPPVDFSWLRPAEALGLP